MILPEHIKNSDVERRALETKRIDTERYRTYPYGKKYIRKLTRIYPRGSRFQKYMIKICLKYNDVYKELVENK